MPNLWWGRFLGRPQLWGGGGSAQSFRLPAHAERRSFVVDAGGCNQTTVMEQNHGADTHRAGIYIQCDTESLRPDKVGISRLPRAPHLFYPTTNYNGRENAELEGGAEDFKHRMILTIYHSLVDHVLKPVVGNEVQKRCLISGQVWSLVV